MLSRRYQNTDWVGEWYRILKRRGENDMCSFVRSIRLSDGKIEDKKSYNFSHSDMDGTAAVSHYMNINGAKSTPRLSSYLKKIPLWKIIKLTYQNLTVGPANSSKWKFFNTDKKIEDLNSFARLALSENETNQFLDYCKKNNISENTVLIKEFSSLVKELLSNSEQEQTWLFPVNVRGIVNKPNPFSNHSSFVPIDVNFQDKYSDIQIQLKEKLKSLSYIGIWWVHHIGVLLGKKKMEKLSFNSSKKNFWLGTISNVGSWKTPESYRSIGDKESWFFAAPGSKNFPIGFVILILNNQMCWSLRVHPSISEEPDQQSNILLKDLKTRICLLI